jgi:hypothetical protein
MALPEELTKDWPAELKSDPSLKDVNDVASLAKRFVDTKALVGGSLRPPGPDAKPEARLEFVTKLREKVPELVLIPDGDDEPAKVAREAAWSRLGKPKEAKEYSLPKDVELAEEHVEALRKEALEEGLTKAQFASRAKRFADALGTAAQQQKEAMTALRKELGAAFDERTASAAAVAAKLGFPESLVSALKSGAVDGTTFKAFSAIAKGFGETRQVAEQGGGAGGKLTPAEAKAQRAEIMARPEYFNPKPSQRAIHQSLVAKVAELNELIGA